MPTEIASIIVPAFNEERLIGRQIAELRKHTQDLGVQIIVGDNHSTDGTVALARTAGAHSVISVSGTVAAVRNRAAAEAPGSVLIFMDADVFPTREWAARLREVLRSLAEDPLVVTGSWVSVPDDASWIERHWFKPLERGDNSHINSGHMIVSRSLFTRLGGFDEGLATGEDFDFSMRAIALGAKIADDPTLKVIHEGYPKSLGEFARREIWHGVGDYRTLAKFLGSKVALVGFAVFHALVIGALLSIALRSASWLLLALGATLGVSLAAALIRYRGAPLRSRVVNAFLYFVYFNARGLSFYSRWFARSRKKDNSASRH